ncbi:MAG TPA: hypothetical protein VJR94_00065, partial [Candidatus Nitrosocosmicus sp.]|nr:hypothetical protein [Candidatus Nitrosocosmicus sp.]
MYNHCKSFPIILTTFIVILLVFNSTLTGISSTIFFQNGASDVNQNNLLTISAFASPEEESGDDSNNDEAVEVSQVLPDVSENMTTVNPSSTALSGPPQNEECPAGSPAGCYVKPSSDRVKESCPPGEMVLNKVPGGPEGTMC